MLILPSIIFSSVSEGEPCPEVSKPHELLTSQRRPDPALEHLQGTMRRRGQYP